MFYEIMHRESCVAQLSTTGECRVCLEDFMPYDLVLVESDDFDERINNVTNFYYWCASRMLTLDRTYAKEILNSIGASQSVTDRERAQIALSYHCLSLLDVFWVKEENEKIRFEDINLFAHSLSNALVDIALRGHQMTVTNAHLLANDLSTGGLYPKAWVRKEDGFYLYKDGGREAVEPASLPVRCFIGVPERLCALPGESAAGLVWGTGCWEMVQEGVSLPVPASGNAFNAALACAWSWEAAFSSHSRAVSRFFSTPNPYRQMIPMLYCSEA